MFGGSFPLGQKNHLKDQFQNLLMQDLKLFPKETYLKVVGKTKDV